MKRVSTREMSREQWLSERRKTVGGSDAAGIIGLSRWSSPYAVWADKTGRLPDKPDTEAMRQGRDLEDYVARRWMEETGKRVRRINALLYNDLYPFAHADIDRMVEGERAGLECKTTSVLNLRRFRGGEFPEQHYVQCVHYLAVTGAERWYLAVLVLGCGFFTFILERDQAEIDALMTAERDFWSLVEKDTPPAPDGTPATAEAIQAIYRDSREEERNLFGREGLLDEYFHLKGRMEELNFRLRQIESTIKEDMGEAERGTCGSYTVRWKSQTRRTFQAGDFQRDHLELDLAQYFKTSTSRPFRVLKSEEEL